MQVKAQAVSVTELIKGTSEKFGSGGLSRFITGIQNVSEPRFRLEQEPAELLGTRDFVTLKNVFGDNFKEMDMTPFKNISDEINAFRKSQSFFSRLCKGRVLDKIQEKCTKIIEIKKGLNLRHEAKKVPWVSETRWAFEAFYAPVNRARPDVITPVKMKTSCTVELPAPEQIGDKNRTIPPASSQPPRPQ